MKYILTISLLSSLSATYAASTLENNDKLKLAIQQLSNQEVVIEAIHDTPLKGIKEVIVKGGPTKQVIYMSEDGEFMFDGQMTNLKSRVNLTQETENKMRHEMLADFTRQHKSIDFLPEKMTEHITVFTDIDCGYCRKLHQEVAQYNELGIGVSYLFFPRSGLNTPSHQKAVNVWCASDQKQAMTSAKRGETSEPLMCPNPIELQYNLGLGVGVYKVGTPAVVFEDGTMIPGYLPAAAMKQRISQVKAQH